MLEQTGKLLKNKKYKIINIDSVIILEKPKLLPYKASMKKNIAKTLKIPPDAVNIKATTTEGVTAHAGSNVISAYSIATINNV